MDEVICYLSATDPVLNQFEHILLLGLGVIIMLLSILLVRYNHGND